MANHLEGINPSKGFSFINWDDLDDEEYIKLNRIIHSPDHGSKVQFPFPKPTAHIFQDNVQESLKTAEPVVTTVFPTDVPPQTMVGYPMQVHWPPATVSIPCHGEGHYPITVQGGYVYPNPSLNASCEATVAFVPAISNGHPVYAYPGVGHPIPAHFQGGTISHHGNESLMLPNGHTVMTQYAMPAVPPHISHSDHTVYPLDLTQQNLPVSISQTSVPVTITHPGVLVNYPQASRSVTLNAETACFVPSGFTLAQTKQEMFRSSAACDEIPLTEPEDLTQASAVTGLPKESQSSNFEFGGPVVFKHKNDKQAILEPNNNYSLSEEKHNVSNQEVVIDIDTNSFVEKSEEVPTPTEDSSLTGNMEGLNVSEEALISNDNSCDSVLPHDNVATQKSVAVPENCDLGIPSVGPKSPIPQQTSTKSWSSLFSKTSHGTNASSVVSGSTVGNQQPPLMDSSSFPSIGDTQTEDFSNNKKDSKPKYIPIEKMTAIGVHSDPLAQTLQDEISDLQVVHTPIVIQPRGLKNGHNTCFLNAPLQVLMGCPPFIHMFRSFKHLPNRDGNQSSTPIIDSLVQFVNSFQNGQRMRNPGSRNKKGGHSDLTLGHPFIPEPLLNVAQNILGLQIGVQHDAEEFLSQILSICNEEMENILKMKDGKDSGKSKKTLAINGDGHLPKNQIEAAGEDEDEAWQQVGPKNHHVETNVNDCGATPLSNIFAGLSRSCLVRESGKTSDTLDSFFTLKLDIQAVNSVKDALLKLNTVETVHDADGRKVTGQRRMFFDVLPPVLIMHLKLFDYSNGKGQKIQKKVTFDVDLQIPKEIISKVGKAKYTSPKSRSYKLFGVVNHHGRHMNDGHYTSDVFLPVASGWLRFDDSDISYIQEADVLYYFERSMPYLLFYRRMDIT